jgi:hypothetical protein
MNYDLLIKFLLFEIVEFTIFWLLAGVIPIPYSQLQIFFGMIVADVIITEIVFPGAFVSLYRAIFRKD